MYGHRRCYITAWLWLSIASLLAGISVFSNSFVFYAVCRGLQGMATAMLLPTALAILGSVYKDGPRKNLAFSLFAAGAPFGFTLWGIISGVITQYAWWPWIYWVTTIACSVLAFISFLAIPRLPTELSCEYGDKRCKQAFDWAGSFTGVSGLMLFNVAWNQAPTTGWGAASTVATVIIGFFLLLSFPFIEKRVETPLIPIDRLSKDSAFVLVIMALAWSSFGVLVFYLVNFLIELRGESIIVTAIQFIPTPIAGFAASYLNSFLLGHGVSPVDVLAFSCIWFMVGNLLLATMPVRQSYWYQAFWSTALPPFGIDLSFPASTLQISRLVPPEQQGSAASLIATVVYYSQSIGLGIAGTVQSHVANGNVLRGYRGAFFTGVGMSGLALLVSLWTVVKLHIVKKL
jgi:MFS family permease